MRRRRGRSASELSGHQGHCIRPPHQEVSSPTLRGRGKGSTVEMQLLPQHGRKSHFGEGARLPHCLFLWVSPWALPSPSLSWSPGVEGPALDKGTQLYPRPLKPSLAPHPTPSLFSAVASVRCWVPRKKVGAGDTLLACTTSTQTSSCHTRAQMRPPLGLAMTEPCLVAVPRPTRLPAIS